MKSRQTGFTLVEIAIVLVIIGLLLGGIIQGQQLINSARVKNLHETASGVQAAYFGFIDRYRQIPGDMDESVADNAIGVEIAGGGNANGRLDNPTGTSAYSENNAAWEHLSKAGFIQGNYDGTADTEPTFSNNLGPVNAFNNPMVLGLTNEYLEANGTAVRRLHLVIGRGVPVGIMRELDLKVDDGVPDTGVLRATITTPTIFLGDNKWGGSDETTGAECTDTSTTPSIWAVANNSPDCNGIFLF
ncbi:MAG: prepilin-type N-terminal cleavage/methylation domain-containing protein [Pseudomonadota bacterium]